MIHQRKEQAWKSVPLGTLAEFRNGVNFTKESFGRGIKVINVKDFQDRFKPSFEDLAEINPEGVVRENDLLEEDDILFVRSNGNRQLIGRSLLIKGAKEPVTHSAFTIRARFRSVEAFPLFYAYALRSYIVRDALSAFGGGTNINNLNQGILSNLQVPLPPLAVQRKIADVLSTYDDLIENNTRRIKILEEMERTLYREWFVHFRFPGHKRVKFIDSFAGKIPEQWKVNPIRELLSYKIGGGWGQDALRDQFTIPARVIRGTDIPDAKNLRTDECPLRYHKESNLKSRRLEPEDIVFEVSGGSKDQPVGRALFISSQLLDALEGDVICASFCKLLRAERRPFPRDYYISIWKKSTTIAGLPSIKCNRPASPISSSPISSNRNVW